MKYPAAANVRDMTLTRSRYFDACLGVQCRWWRQREERSLDLLKHSARSECTARFVMSPTRFVVSPTRFVVSPHDTHIMTVSEPKWANSALLLVLLTEEHVLTAK